MKELLLKILQWCVSAFFLIIGIKMLVLTQQGETWALFIAIVSFGVVYWQYNAKNTMPWQIMVTSVVILLGAGVASYYLSIFTFFPFNTGFYGGWVGWTFIAGVPLIGLAFKKWG